MKKIRVILADDHAVLRAGLKTLFEVQPDIEVIAEAADGIEAMRKSLELSPDILLLDISMPGLSGFEVTQQLKRSNPDIRILILTMHDDENYLHQIIRAGADGYIPKKAADNELMAAIRATYRGENFIHSSMTRGLFMDLRTKETPPVEIEHDENELSEREQEVLRYLAMGYSNQEIADKLFLSIKTVETYKARVKEKLGLSGRADLVRYAIRKGLLNIEA